MSFSAFSSPSSSNNNELRNDERAGIIPRAVDQVFDHVARRTRSESGRWKCEIKTSYVEIYSESQVWGLSEEVMLKLRMSIADEELIDLLAGDVGVSIASVIFLRSIFNHCFQ